MVEIKIIYSPGWINTDFLKYVDILLWLEIKFRNCTKHHQTQKAVSCILDGVALDCHLVLLRPHVSPGVESTQKFFSNADPWPHFKEQGSRRH